MSYRRECGHVLPPRVRPWLTAAQRHPVRDISARRLVQWIGVFHDWD
jgi:hypothetical protein